MRNLICRPAARLSRWMSLAPSLSASRRVERTRRTTSLDSSEMLLSDRSSTARSASPPTAASSRSESSARIVSSWLAR